MAKAKVRERDILRLLAAVDDLESAVDRAEPIAMAFAAGIVSEATRAFRDVKLRSRGELEMAPADLPADFGEMKEAGSVGPELTFAGEFLAKVSRLGGRWSVSSQADQECAGCYREVRELFGDLCEDCAEARKVADTVFANANAILDDRDTREEVESVKQSEPGEPIRQVESGGSPVEWPSGTTTYVPSASEALAAVAKAAASVPPSPPTPEPAPEEPPSPLACSYCGRDEFKSPRSRTIHVNNHQSDRICCERCGIELYRWRMVTHEAECPGETTGVTAPAACVHHFVLGRPEGLVVRGECKHCGAKTEKPAELVARTVEGLSRR